MNGEGIFALIYLIGMFVGGWYTYKRFIPRSSFVYRHWYPSSPTTDLQAYGTIMWPFGLPAMMILMKVYGRVPEGSSFR